MSKFFALTLFIFCFACTDKRTEETVAPPLPAPKYYFFPKANVYFDSVNKDYLFLTNAGQTWSSAKQIPDVMQSMMDKSVLIDSPASPVWKDNQNHKLVYSALLYASPNDTMQKKALPPPLLRAGNADTVKKEKKGLRKFFDKLFGRKKKNKEPEE